MKPRGLFRALGVVVPLVFVAVVVAALARWVRSIPPVVRLGYGGGMGDLPVYVASEEGFFEKAGVRIRFVACGEMELTHRLFQGTVDVAGPMDLAVLLAAEAASPGLVRCFLLSEERVGGALESAVLVRADSPLAGIEDLAGRSLGVGADPRERECARLILEGAGLSGAGVRIVTVPLGAGALMLASGACDALLAADAGLWQMQGEAGVRVLVANPRARFIADPYWTRACAVTSRYLSQHPERVARVIAALDMAVEYIAASWDEGRFADWRVSFAEEAGGGRPHFAGMRMQPGEVEGLQAMADRLYQAGLLPRRVDVSAMLLAPEDLAR